MQKAFEEFVVEAKESFAREIAALGFGKAEMDEGGVRVEVAFVEGHRLPCWELYLDGNEEGFLPLDDISPAQAAAYVAGFINGRLNFPMIGGVPYRRARR